MGQQDLQGWGGSSRGGGRDAMTGAKESTLDNGWHSHARPCSVPRVVLPHAAQAKIAPVATGPASVLRLW
jgi:hypothetical protein